MFTFFQSLFRSPSHRRGVVAGEVHRGLLAGLAVQFIVGLGQNPLPKGLREESEKGGESLITMDLAEASKKCNLFLFT